MIEANITKKRYTLRFKEEPIDIEDEKGNVKSYLLKEFSGTIRDLYNEEIGRRFEVGADGKTAKIKNYQGWESTLLKLCMFEVTSLTPYTLVPVDEKTVQAWPASIRAELHKEAQRICGLNDDAEKDAKND